MFEVNVDEKAQANGLAMIVSDLIRQNIKNAPWKEGDAKSIRGDISIFAQDAGVKITLSFRGDKLVVMDGESPHSSISITADTPSLLDISRIKLIAKIPFFLDADGIKVIKNMIGMKVKMKISSPLKALDMFRLLRVFSIYS